MSEHTPGPWRAAMDSADGQIGLVRAPTPKNGRDELCVAVVSAAKTQNEREANARLIAAAPALLDGGTCALAIVESLVACGQLKLSGSVGAQIAALRDAIAKVGGCHD